MPTPTISQGQIAVDPVKGILYYKNNSGVLVNTSLNWSQSSDTLIQTQDSVQIDSNLIISGNLTVQGNTTTLNTETFSVEDNIVILNSSVTGVPSFDAGIEVERGSSTNVQLRWNETNDEWQFTNDGTTYVNVASTVDISNHESDTTNIHGIADTANLVTLADEQTLTNKTLTNPTITGVSPVINLAGDLTGSVTLTDLGNGTLTATIVQDSVALGTHTIGDYVQDLVAGIGITISNNSGEGATPKIAVTENTYDAYGAASSAASGAATALSNHESDTTNIHGIADTANLVTLADEQTLTNKTLTNPTITGVSPVINLAGDLTGSVTLTDLGNGTLTATIVQDSVALGTHTIGDYVQDLVAGIGITISNNSGEGATPTIEVTTHTYEEYGSVADHGSETTNIHGIANTADLVTLAGTQNLTNKTLTSPTIKNVSPTITLEGDLTGSVTLTDLNSGALTATIAEYSIDSSHISLAFQYVENISAGNNIVINNEYVGPGAVGNYTIETSDTPNFASVTTTSLIVDDIEIDPTGANSSDQVLRFDSENNKFIPGVVASTVANNSVSSNKLNLLYANTSVFPSASTHHGSIAHSHADGAMFFAHDGNWIKMISEEDGYVASVTSGNNIVITNNVEVGGLDPIIAVDDNPSFGNVSASSLTISSIEIDPTGANSGQVLKFNGIKFVAGDDQGSELSVIERYSEVIGNNYDTVFQINHSLGTRNVLVEIYDNITYETIMTKIARTTINSITVSFATVIPTNSYTVVVIG